MVQEKTATPQVAAYFTLSRGEAIRQALLRLHEAGFSPRLIPWLEELGVGLELPPSWWEELWRALNTLESLGLRPGLLYAYQDPEEGERVVDLEGLLAKAFSLGEGVWRGSSEAFLPLASGESALREGTLPEEGEKTSPDTPPPSSSGGGSKRPPKVSVEAPWGDWRPEPLFLLLGVSLLFLNLVLEVFRR